MLTEITLRRAKDGERYCFRHAVAHAFLAHEDFDLGLEDSGFGPSAQKPCPDCVATSAGKHVLGDPLKYESRPFNPSDVDIHPIFPGDETPPAPEPLPQDMR